MQDQFEILLYKKNRKSISDDYYNSSTKRVWEREREIGEGLSLMLTV